MNTGTIKTIVILSFLPLIVACNKSVPNILNTYNKSTYSLNTTPKTSANDSVKVNFTFIFSEQNTTSNPVQVKAGCEIFRTTENELEIKVGKMDMPIQFKITSIGYFSIETVPIETNEIDSISVGVNFVEDDRPLTHCPQASTNQTKKGTDANC